MKSLKIFSVATLSMFLATAAFAQEKTESFKVSGNCGMCKNKIETAAKEAGAKAATWDADTKMLTVSYKAKSTNTAKIQSKIAEVGYDNVGAKANEDAYNKLHGCCKYDRGMTSVKTSCCKDESTCKHHEGKTETNTAMADCCKDGKCTMPGHDGKDCCKKAEQ